MPSQTKAEKQQFAMPGEFNALTERIKVAKGSLKQMLIRERARRHAKSKAKARARAK